MTDKQHAYDPDLPYVVAYVSTGRICSRHAEKGDALDNVTAGRRLIDTTPAPPLPTEPGIYVPRKNLARLGQTNSYRLSEDGVWSEAFGARVGEAAADRAMHAQQNLGGLVRLELVLEERKTNDRAE